MKLLNTAFVTTLFAVASSMLTSCTKDHSAMLPAPVSTDCTSNIYGYYSTSVSAPTYGMYMPHSLAVLNPASGAASTTGVINASIYKTQGTINVDDNCYYMIAKDATANQLYKIGMTTGALSSYSFPAGTTYLTGLVYNAYTHQLMAVKDGITDSVVVVTPGTTSFSYTPVASASLVAHHLYSTSVDQATGTLYYSAVDSSTPSSFSVGKLAVGATAGTLINAGVAGIFSQMHFNRADNMLYGIYWAGASSTPNHLMRISSTGATTMLGAISEPLNGDFYSTCLDACKNKYIIASMAYNTAAATWMEDSSTIYQYDMSGTLQQQANVGGIFSGLDVKY